MRNKRAILYEILFALEQGSLKITHIMYIVNAPPARLKQYLVELRKRELVEKKGDLYVLSVKGSAFCAAYRQMTHLP